MLRVHLSHHPLRNVSTPSLQVPLEGDRTLAFLSLVGWMQAETPQLKARIDREHLEDFWGFILSNSGKKYITFALFFSEKGGLCPHKFKVETYLIHAHGYLGQVSG